MQTSNRTASHPVRLALVCATLALATVLAVTVALTYRVQAAPQTPAATRQVTQCNDVCEAQFILISHGYVGVGPADGILGPKTRAAVRQWQRANGLWPDGIPGPITRASLAASVAPFPVVRAVRLDPPLAPAVGDPGPSDGDVVSIIRDVWSGEPADVVDKAVRTAWRESNWVPTVRNFCCFGLFQIYYSQHRAWLGDYGVNQASDLFDPRTNATVALALYQAAGWGPWAGGA